MNNFIAIQDKFVQIINNAHQSKRISHAILIEGTNKELLDSAIEYVSMAIMCQESSVCLKCNNCLRIANGQNSDIITFDLSDVSLKKENVLDIQSRFNKTALEQTNKQIYVIKYIENANSIALNALLKFVEEPNPNVYAIFTTLNANQVLNTITSRTTLLRIKPQPFDQVVKYYKEIYPPNEIDYITSIISDEILIDKTYNSNVFINFKDNANRLFKALLNNNFYLAFYEMAKDYDKEEIQILLELLYAAFVRPTNLRYLKVDEEVIQKLCLIENLEVCLDILISSRLKLQSNMNKSLLIDQVGIEIEAICNENS
ncbi:MAG: hypothetical protein ACRCTA_05770 [Bacilli bacterium]